MLHSISCRLGILAVAAGVAAFAPLAHADANDSNRVAQQVIVRFGDLNLQNPGAAETLLTRITRAGTRVCGGAEAAGVSTPSTKRAFRTCRSRAVQEAVAKVNHPLLT